MKTLSGTLAFVVLAVIAIVAVFTIRAFAFATPRPAFANQKFVLQIGGPGKEDYVDLKKSQGAFDDALNALENHGGQYHIRFLRKAGEPPIDPYRPHRHVSIKTDKVTKSEVANSTAGESAANDPNVTYHLASNNPTDVQTVLDTFK